MEPSIRKIFFLMTLICLFLWNCSNNDSTNESVLTPVAELFQIDGNIDFAAVGTTQQQSIDIRDSFGAGSTTVQTSTLKWATQNDDRNLYIALEWDDTTQNSFDPTGSMDDFDGILIIFDNNGNGTLDENEDAHRLVMTDYGSSYNDLHVNGTDMSDDVVGDGLGKMRYSSGDKKYTAEFLIPLAADTNGEDGVLDANTRLNIIIYDHVEILIPQGNVGALSGSITPSEGTDTSLWPDLSYTTPGIYDQPDIPSELTGLIVFISDHENPEGELYTYNPASGTISKVTDSTGLYMDGASLSHDRTRIAFYGAPDKTDFAAYEIYTVNIDGTNLTSFTSNLYLDGHPAWAPDDSQIVYASFRSGGIASLILANSDGSGIESNLTPVGWNDNDPEWTPDGRIVFKTDRFGTAGSPQVRIAVMDSDGTNVIQLTNTGSTSDHDPMATSTTAIFERFTKGTEYSTDPTSFYSAWNIVEANVDGSGEYNLLADGWINWLPVYDPTSHYIVYLKTVGYTDARLMNTDGRDLGRLIQNQTQIRYIDWK